MSDKQESENFIPPQDIGNVPPDQKPVDDERTEIRNRLQSASELFNAELARWQEIQPCLEQRPDIKKLIERALGFLKIKEVFFNYLDPSRASFTEGIKDKESLFRSFAINGFGTDYFHNLFYIDSVLSRFNSGDPNWHQIRDVIHNMSKIIKDFLVWGGWFLKSVDRFRKMLKQFQIEVGMKILQF